MQYTRTCKPWSPECEMVCLEPKWLMWGGMDRIVNDEKEYDYECPDECEH